MKNYLLSILMIFAFTFGAIGQDTLLVDFETVQDLIVDPFDLASYESVVANPDKSGINTSDYVGEAVKINENPADTWGYAFWGGINIYFGGDVEFTGTDDKFTIDFYTEDAGVNDTILFKFQLFNRYGGVETIEVDAYYTDANDTDVSTWKTLEFAIPDGTTGSYNQMVMFFGWTYSNDGDTYYFDNVVAPGYSAYGNTDVTFSITDKFNNATDVKLFIDGTETDLTQTDNVYSATESLASYNVTVGEGTGVYEIVYSHMAGDTEVRDTSTLLVGNSSGTQEVTHLVIVEEEEDGTATAVSVGDAPPTIDGTIDDVWDNAKTHTMQQRSWWGSATGLYSQWKVMWDEDNVYLLYIVEDATLVAVNTTDVYKNDCIETFFDMDQSASEGYDANDWQIRTVRNSDIWSGSANVDDTWAENLDRAQVEMDDNAGYIIEMAIPWTSLSSSFLPLDGSEFNYECVAADVTADGGARTYREAWTSTEDNAYLTTANFGTITLSDETSEFTSVENVMQVPNLSVYPNPVIDRLNIQAGLPIAEVEIYDIMGRKTSFKTDINETSFVMSVDKLDKNAIYIVKITDVKGNVSARKITVQ